MEQLAFSVASLASQMPFADYASEFQDDSDYEDGLQSEIRTIASRETHLSKSEIHVANLKAFIADQERVAVAGDSSNSHLPKASSTETTFADSLDPIATQNPDTGIPNFPIFVQVPPPNEHFYSRTVLLQDLDNCLSSSGTTCMVLVVLEKLSLQYSTAMSTKSSTMPSFGSMRTLHQVLRTLI
jgi:hypothetical protein